MIDLLLTHVFIWAEMLAMLISLICWKRLLRTPFFYFIPYLIMTVAAEWSGVYTGLHHHLDVNNQIFNITTLLEFSFFYFLFFSSIKSISSKKIILVLTAFYLVSSLVNILFIQGFSTFNSYTMLIGTMVVVFCVFLYFYSAFEQNITVNLLKEPMFWVSIGIFLFYLGDFTFNLMYPFLQKNNLKSEQHLFKLINNNLIIFEYLCFAVALIVFSCYKQDRAIKD